MKHAFSHGVSWPERRSDFDAAHYVASTSSSQLISWLILRLRARGLKVVLYLTPEHSLLRSGEPANVATLIEARLRAATAHLSTVVLDLRSAVADDGFVDFSHLHLPGNREFTVTLGNALGGSMVETAVDGWAGRPRI